MMWSLKEAPLHCVRCRMSTCSLSATQFPIPSLPLPPITTQDDRAKTWRIQAVSAAPGSFESRKALPEAWRGLRDEALSEATGVPGCVFIHASGFIGGAATKEGVLALARLALA